MSNKYVKRACALMVIMGVHNAAVQAKVNIEREEEVCHYDCMSQSNHEDVQRGTENPGSP